jgi:hypothetical protein
MQEMKLLDIETSKYLELGKDFFYGGKCISCFYDSVNELHTVDDFKNAIEQGFYADCNYIKVEEISEPQEPLKTLCDLTGAVVYGGRYVLNPHYATMRAVIVDGGEYGKIYRIESLYKCKIQNYVISGDEYLKYRPELVYTESGYTEFYIYGNPFEEYSKSLRNEENKLEEILNLIK